LLVAEDTLNDRKNDHQNIISPSKIKASEEAKLYYMTDSEIEMSSVLYSSVSEIPVSQCPRGEIDTPMAYHCKSEETFLIDNSVNEKRRAENKDVSLYAQVDKKKKKGNTFHIQPEPPVDLLYAQVDKKNKKDGSTTHINTPESETPVDQLYAQVDKKKKKGNTTHYHTPEAETPVDQLYAQVDKKKKEGNTTHYHTPEAETPTDQLYAQVDKKRKKDGEYYTSEAAEQDGDIIHPHTPEAVCQLYARVNKKGECEGPPRGSEQVNAL
jgi:hypothetical protein